MILLDNEKIQQLNVDNKDILQWVKEAFLSKEESLLPHKISITFDEGKKFYNTMPTIMPSIESAGVKIVSRYPSRHPSIQGHILLYDLKDGTPLSMMDATWITAKRTGAVAYLALKTFTKKNYNSIAIMGFGQTGQAFLEMFTTEEKNKSKQIKLLKYRDHANKIAEQLKNSGFYNVEICDTYQELIEDSDVVVSAVTYADKEFGKDEWFKEGVLVIPIHTRWFQNCDLFFDKIFADDVEHVKDFKYFNKFKSFGEIDQVLKKKIIGRSSPKERILSYNIGIALHDIYIARKIYDIANSKGMA